MRKLLCIMGLAALLTAGLGACKGRSTSNTNDSANAPKDTTNSGMSTMPDTARKDSVRTDTSRMDTTTRRP